MPAVDERSWWYAEVSWQGQSGTFRAQASTIETACRTIRAEAAALWMAPLLAIDIANCARFVPSSAQLPI